MVPHYKQLLCKQMAAIEHELFTEFRIFQILVMDRLRQWFSTCGLRPPWGSPDDLPGVGWDLQKFVSKVVSIWIYTAMQSKFILLQCQLLNSELSVLQLYYVLISPSSTLFQTGFPVCWFFLRLSASYAGLSGQSRHSSHCRASSLGFLFTIKQLPPHTASFSFDNYS